MDPLSLIDKYYAAQPLLREILLVHSRAVADKALQIARNHPELTLDITFVEEAALLHDIGIIYTNAPAIQCFGTHPYICHGTLGAAMLRDEGLPRHALVCERHTGAGISLAQIQAQRLPLPQRDLLPVSLEEVVVCFADKFFSKTRLTHEKSVEGARRSLEKFGDEGLQRFDEWCKMFL